MANQLKILQVLRAPVGGLFRHVCDLTAQLDKMGHAVGVVVDRLSYDQETEKKLDAIKDHARLGIHPIAIPRLFGPHDLSAPFKLQKLINRLDIDVVHGHGAKGGFHGRLAAWGKRDVKKIYTPHGGVLHFAKNSPQGMIFHNLERALLPITDKIVFESRFAADSYEQQIANAGEKAAIVHNGLLEDEFTPIASDGEYDFVFIGEMRDLKGVEVLLRAFAPLKNPHDEPATLLLIGDGPHRALFEGLCDELELGERVKFVGARPAKDGFARADIVVVPSLKESLPYIVMEAIAAGKAVITTNVGGIPEIFGPERDALVPAGDIEALRERMAVTLSTLTQNLEHKRRLFAHVHTQFSVSKMTDVIVSLYQK